MRSADRGFWNGRDRTANRPRRQPRIPFVKHAERGRVFVCPTLLVASVPTETPMIAQNGYATAIVTPSNSGGAYRHPHGF